MVDLIPSVRATFVKIKQDMKTKVSKGELLFNIKDYGAVGNGTNDDTSAIIACLAAARNSAVTYGGMAEVFAPPGNYVVGSTLNPGLCRITGYGATFTLKSGITDTNMFVHFTQTFSILGLTIDMNRANTTYVSSSTGIAIFSYRATGGGDLGEFIDVTVKNAWGAGIRVGAAVISDQKNAPNTPCLLQRVTVTNCFTRGIWCQGGRGIRILNCYVNDNQGPGIWVGNDRDTVISENQVYNNAIGGIYTSYVYGTQIIGNTSNDNGFAGITMGGGSLLYPPSRNFRIVGNHCMGNVHHGITLDTTLEGAGNSGVSQPCYGTIVGNYCARNGYTGGNGTGIYLHNAAYVSATGNVCEYNWGAGIALDGHTLSVTGNTVVENGTYGLELRSIADTPDHGNLAVRGNTVRGNGNNSGFHPGGPKPQYDIFTHPLITDSPVELIGIGSPEGVYTGCKGSVFHRTDGSTGTTEYYKESPASITTGWVARGSGGGSGTLPDVDYLSAYNNA